MSLVNQLLQDLESRKNKKMPGNEIPKGLQSVEQNTKSAVLSRKSTYYFLTFVIIAGVAVTLYWPTQPAKQMIVKRNTVPVVVAKAHPKKVIVQPKAIKAKAPKPVLKAKPVMLAKQKPTPSVVTPKKPVPVVVKKKVVVPLTPKKLAAKDYNLAVKRINEGQLHKGQLLLQQALSKYPRFSEARVSLAAMLAKTKPADALNMVENGLKLTPNSPKLIIAKTQILVELKLFKEATTTLASISPSMKKYPAYYELRAALSQRTGNYKIAVQAYHSLIESNPHNGKYWLGIGIAFNSLDQTNAAKRAFSEALSTGSLNPNMQIFARAKINELGGA